MSILDKISKVINYPRIKVTKEDLKLKIYGSGDIFIEKNTNERVMVGSVRLSGGEKIIELISEDRLFDDKPIVYHLPEKTFLEMFNKDSFLPEHYKDLGPFLSVST